MDFFSKLFDSSDFPARWHCGRWTVGHGYLHIASDFGIFMAYTAIPILLLYVLRRTGRSLPEPMPRLIGLFIGFILFCGLTHLLEAVIFYEPIYRFAGLVKLATAGVSWATVVALAPALPGLLALKTPSELEKEVAEATKALRKERDAKAALDELLIHVVDASPSGMLATNDQGEIVLANVEVAQLFGYDKAELLGQTVEMLVPEKHRERHPMLRQRYLQSPSARKMGESAASLVGQRKDGSTFPIEVGLNPIATPNGLWILTAIVDRTGIVAHQESLQQKHAELERSNIELEGFASAASHDLKAPLRAIQNALQWIEEDIDPTALTGEVRENFDLVKQRAKRMESLLHALLDYARAGRISAPPVMVDCTTAIFEIVQFLGPEAERAVRFESELPQLQTTRVLFDQVFSNLISNALKHSRKSDVQVVVRGRVEGSECVFEVQDNGPGIEPRFHERVFNVFQTLRPRDEVEGAGMGLALVKKVVEGEGGSVSIKSEPGSGATFIIRWPHAPPPRSAETERSPS